MSKLNNKTIAKMTPITGSYSADDCLFLLQEVEAEFKDVADKEMLIQSGQMHYSEMISQESAPTEDYLDLFYRMTEANKYRLAIDSINLANIIAKNYDGYGKNQDSPIVIMSLARAGTPIGVIIKKTLELMGLCAVHYSISIIRDKGIDAKALAYVTDRYSDSSLCFIDGWTAKGVITKELHSSVDCFNVEHGASVPNELYVISDIGATADFSATMDDYAIPSSLLNSTVSGLVSRSIHNEKTEGGFHGCIRYKHLKKHDVSEWFVDEVMSDIESVLLFDTSLVLVKADGGKNAGMQKEDALNYLSSTQEKYSVSDINRIKPGIAEATRVMLRRVPDLLILRDLASKDSLHLVKIAEEKGIDIVTDTSMPYGAVALIKDVL